MAKYLVRLSAPVYYDVPVEASSPEEAESWAKATFYLHPQPATDYGPLKVLRSAFLHAEPSRPGAWHSRQLRGRYRR
jgi:hypothetical protein